MTMLLGEFHCRTDGEGQLKLPSAFRDELAEGAAMTRGIERCLLVYPAGEWRKLAERIGQRLPFTSRPARTFSRFIFSGAAISTPDRDGQLCLPDHLCRYAEIEDEVIVVGLLSYLEIWSLRRWNETRSSFVEAGAALAEELREYGI